MGHQREQVLQKTQGSRVQSMPITPTLLGPSRKQHLKNLQHFEPKLMKWWLGRERLKWYEERHMAG
eukprot:CAMPEP_0205934658 /NCGR_PEP_ID=MMETSP1325-20131115/36919_1 /ASSEMBLY_ACC=CAM_ASM_000708 /TAXON_ID=236786 /ORGANISM="Florenciella sp., Strain RCC1007" /LENGTH=65 /DNA_ID=CAMNT_0053304661 /DNA_START=309 /DNA_END=506 /DNA_ORIENTATION=-